MAAVRNGQCLDTSMGFTPSANQAASNTARIAFLSGIGKLGPRSYEFS
ncbi:hypothetical protein Pla22_23420 [Rubripirellula amarantea]|uniref:Uncharacterized protein n=2 Tax=Rubripirellula amarantea TaxID=2527999 RepID=A0A5C5WXU2_9BACT|nr:hypothetical protein Pla22_23420 [Rubripirellula amarantea]